MLQSNVWFDSHINNHLPFVSNVCNETNRRSAGFGTLTVAWVRVLFGRESLPSKVALHVGVARRSARLWLWKEARKSGDASWSKPPPNGPTHRLGKLIELV